MRKKFFKAPHIVTYLCAFVLGLKQLREPDVWWQLLTGRWMLENGTVTKVDPFSFTAEGTSWINVKWLYEVIIAILEKLAGPHGVLLLQAVVNVGIVYLLFRLLELIGEHINIKISTFSSVAAALLFLGLSEYRMAGRPEMVSHLMMVIYLYLICRGKDLGWKQIIPLAVLQCLWANMHEGYPVGMVIIGVFAGSTFLSYIINKDKAILQQGIRISAVWAVAAIAILINPNGIQLWLQPFEIFRQLGVNKYTTELYSYTQPQYWTLQAKTHLLLLGIVILFWTIRIITGRKTKEISYSPQLIGYFLLIPLMGYLSLSANRNIPFAQIVMMPSYAIMLHSLAKQLKIEQKQFYINISKRAAIISIAIGAAFYISVVSNGFYELTGSKNKYGVHVSMLNNPTGAADFIKRHNVKGPAFSDYFVSSYLLWDLYPDFRSYIDLRDLDIFSSKFFDEYFELYTDPSKFRAIDSQYNFNYIVLSTSQLKGLQTTLYWGEGYNLIYVDPVSVIYLKNSKENDHLNKNYAIQKLFSWPQSYDDPAWAIMATKLFNPVSDVEEEEQEENSPLYAAMFFNTMKNYRASKKLLQPAVQYGPLQEDPRALAAMGSTFIEVATAANTQEEQNTALDSARIFFEKAIDEDKNESGAYMGSANVYLMQGDPLKAIEQMAKYIKLKPNDDFGYYLYGISYHYALGRDKSQKNADQLIYTMKQAIRLNEHNTKPYLYIAEGYAANNNITEARNNLQKALDSKSYWTTEEQQMLTELKKTTGVQ